MLRFSAVLLAALAISSTSHAGILYFSQDNNANGLYILNTTTGAATFVGQTGVNSQTVGLTETANPGVLYGSQPFGFRTINADGSGSSGVGSMGIEGLATDPTSGTVYGSINGSFFTVNTATGGVQTSLAAPGADVEGLAWGNGGVYGLADGGNLYFYDPNTNMWMLIGNSGVNFDQVGLAYDPGTNVLYAIGNQNSNLYRIDLNSGFAATVIGDTGLANQGGGLAYVTAIPEPASLAVFALVGLAGGVYARRRKARAG